MSRTSSSKSPLFVRFFLLLGFLAATSLALAINREKDHPNRTDRRHRGRNSTPTPRHPSCPVRICDEIPSDCNTVEYLVAQYDDERSGQVISCQSCSYCLDLPRLPSSSRQRRDLLQRLLFNEANSNGVVISCPPVPDSCSDVRMTRTRVSGQSTAFWSVTHCPVCFDSTLNTRRHRRSTKRPSFMSL